jgi:hypothetical protein
MMGMLLTGKEYSVSTDKKYDKIKLPQPQTKNAL